MAQEEAANIIDLNASRERADQGVAADDGVLAGELLAKARRAAGFSLANVSAETKIKIDHLTALEASDFETLPITAYAVGFVKVYASFLGLDAQDLGARFKSEREEATVPVEELAHASVAQASSPHISNGARLVSIFGILAILIFVVWIVINVAGSPGENGDVRTVSAPERRVRLGNATLEGPVVRPRENPAPVIGVSGPVQTGPVQSVGEQAEANVADAGVEDANVGGNSAVPVAAENNPPTDRVVQPLQQEQALPETAQPETVAVSEVAQVPAEEISSAAGQALETPIELPGQEDISSPLAADEVATEILPEVEAVPVREIPARRTPPIRRSPEPAPIVIEAKLTRSLSPQYPNRCTRNAEPLETVTVMFDVTPRGRAANIRAVGSSNNCFESAAISTLRRWRFSPRTVNGVAQADVGKQATLNFRR